jgi:hypothetical protein
MAFSYMQMVFGYLAGYGHCHRADAHVLPHAAHLDLRVSGKAWILVTIETGAGFFLLSRTLGSAARMFLAASNTLIFDA